MSDIRFNQWLHQSGTGGVTQLSSGHVGIGTTNPLIPVHSGNNAVLNVGVVTANNIYAGTLNGTLALSDISGITGSFTSDLTVNGSNLDISDKIRHIGDTNTAIRFPANDTISFETGSSEKFRIGSDGQIGLSGTNYGTAGQVLTSQGSGSAVQWATPASGWVHGTETALNGNVTLIKNGVPDGASHIRYLFRYVSTNSTAQPYVQVEYNNNGTIKNSNYQTCSTTTRNGSPQVQGDSDKTDGLQLWYGYTNAGNALHGVLDIYRIGTSGTDGTNMYMSFHGMGNSSSSGYDATHSAQGYFEIGTGSTDYVSGIKISTQNGAVQFDNGYIQQSYLLS